MTETIYNDDSIDIEEYSDGNIVRLNKNELGFEGRKILAAYLRSKISYIEYRFKQGIHLQDNQKLEITISDQPINNIDVININGIEIKLKRYKNSYDNLHLVRKIFDDEEEYYLIEGCRHLSSDETSHVIDLIYTGSIMQSLGIDLWAHKE